LKICFAVCWDLVLSVVVEIALHVSWSCCLHLHGSEAAGSCDTLISFYQTTQHHIPDDCNLHFKNAVSKMFFLHLFAYVGMRYFYLHAFLPVFNCGGLLLIT
jgi:hypothetical protein